MRLRDVDSEGQDPVLEQWPFHPWIAAAMGYFKAQSDRICSAAEQGHSDSCLNSTHSRSFNGGLQCLMT